MRDRDVVSGRLCKQGDLDMQPDMLYSSLCAAQKKIRGIGKEGKTWKQS